MNIFNIAVSRPWLMRPESLRTILEICSRENAVTPEIADRITSRREALATTRAGSAPDGTRYTTRRPNGVAVINITGPIFRYADLFTEVSGGTATANLASDFVAAVRDPATRAIVLNIDSPGGEATGIHELAQTIFQARGSKPIVSYIEGLGASAAYWIASATDEIVADRTALVGSIGVVFAVSDPSKSTSKNVEIVSVQSPKKRLDPTTDAGRGELQRLANDLASVFVENVARNRRVSESSVLADFGQGSLLSAEAARRAKMIDRLSSLESLVEELGRPRPAAVRMAATAAARTPAVETPTADDLKMRSRNPATAQKIAAYIAARRQTDPAFDLKRLWSEAEAGTPQTVSVPVLTLDDLKAAARDAAASRRVSAVLEHRRLSDPAYNHQKFRDEVSALAAKQ